MFPRITMWGAILGNIEPAAVDRLRDDSGDLHLDVPQDRAPHRDRVDPLEHELSGGGAPGRQIHDPVRSDGGARGPRETEDRAREALSVQLVLRIHDDAIGVDVIEPGDRLVGPEFLGRAGELLGSDQFIPVDYVQIAGVSYKTITETGLELRRNFASKYRFRARRVTINPAGMDLQDWKALGIPADFARKQEEVIELYRKMGASLTITCTPYLIGEMPEPFTDAFLSESSVVAYANSVLGIRSNRESGLSTLLYAIAGYGPRYGLHLPENRNPRVEVHVDCDLHGVVDFGLLGYHLGELARGRVPYITGLRTRPTLEEFKVLSAAGAASGSIDLYHIEGVTPEAESGRIALDRLEAREVIDRASLDAVKRTLNTGSFDRLDLVTFGCPHASLDEVKEIAALLAGKSIRPGVQLWVCTSRAVKELATKLGYVATVEAAGGNVVADTCMVVAPIEEMGPTTTATNSGKAAKYLPRFCHQNVVFESAEEIIHRIAA